MPQLLLIGLAGAGLVLGIKWLNRTKRRIAEDLARADEALARRHAEAAKDGGRLVRDTGTGLYRLPDRQ